MVDEQEELEGQQEQEPSAGDSISDAYDSASQDLEDIDTLSGGKVKEGLSDARDRILGHQKPEGQDTGKGEKAEKPRETSEQKTAESQKAESKPAQQPEGQVQGETPPGHQPAATQGTPAPAVGESTGQAVNAGEKGLQAGRKATQTGQRVADVAQKGEKIAEVGAKGAQAVGTAAEGGAAAVEAGSAAVAPETAGTSLAVAAGAEAAKDAPKVAKEALKTAKEGARFKDKIEAADRLFKKHWWKVCGCCVVPFVILVTIGYYAYTKLFELIPGVKAVKTIVSLYKKFTGAGTLKFTDPASQKAIEENKIGETTLRILTDLSKKHDVNIVYKGVSTATGKENQPYEFDLVEADYIKCTNPTTKEKADPISISLKADFKWSEIIGTGRENYLCAVDYYPLVESIKSSPYSLRYGPGQFNLGEIDKYGPQAAQQKTFELVDLAMQKSSENAKSESDFPVSSILINPYFYQSNLKTGEAGAAVASIEKSQKLFADQKSSGIIRKNTSVQGVHFGFD